MPTFDQLPCPALVTNRAGLVKAINQRLLKLIGGNKDQWLEKSMESMFPVASRIFLQTHVWPMLIHEGYVQEIRLQVLNDAGERVPVFANCQQTIVAGIEELSWVLFVTVERSRYEQALLEARARAEAVSGELANRERFIRTITDAMPSLIGYWDKQLVCQFANQPYLQWFGKTPEQMVGSSMIAVLGEKLFELNLPYIRGALAGVAQEFERDITKPDGSIGQVLANYLPDKDAQGNTNGFFALLTNISRLREADAAIRLSASVFQAATEGIMVTAPDEAVGHNARILKSGRHDVAFFQAMFQALHAHKLWKGEVWCRRKDGSIFLEQLSISAIGDNTGEISQYVGVFSDITEKWSKQQVIQHMALYDSLTGLPNRALLMERLGQLLATAGREPRQIALMFLDLDGFKKVNDTFGHAMGDKVLKTVSARLLGLLRTADTVARLGGDEFIILLNNPESADSLARIAARIIEEINLPMDFAGTIAHVGTSIGIAFVHTDGMTADMLLKTADDAMYAAKAAGKNTCRFAQ
jgi:diguanylate cyclase (GGDEF)-like protein/PAS domain S-box-containing protein